MDASTLKTGTISATVRFSLSAEAMHGRAGLRSGILPNHWMHDRDYTFIGKLDFIDCDFLAPGEACDARVTLIVAEQDRERFVPGFVWQIGESVHIIGECKLLSIERPYEPIEREAERPASWADPGNGTLLRRGDDLGKGWS